MDLIGAGLLFAVLALNPPDAAVGEHYIVVASTTSTENSGLFRHILPIFERASGIKPRVVALGTGQALDLARRGDADVLLVHDRAKEEQFVAEGHGLRRFDLMHNDFVLLGPDSDPAGVAGSGDITLALRRIVAANADKGAGAPAVFVSRGDRSGTHAAELRLWQAAGIDLAAVKGPWYRDTGSGMGQALNTAAAMNAYLLADRGTWLSFRNRQRLVVLVQGDARLFNPYGVMLVNPARHPHVRQAQGQQFIDWLLSAAGQQAIADYRIGGEQLFFPAARR